MGRGTFIFFKLSAWQDKLIEYYKNNPDFISPKTRYNEVISFVSSGLEDLSISRTTFKWGIQVPNNSDHIIYVWLDALTNYISAINYPNTDSKEWNNFWPASIHVVGKDILRFHAVYWPAFLMAAGIELPKKIYAHGWWTVNNQKMSKSLGNVVDPNKIIDNYGLDQVKYFLLREVKFGQDGDYSEDALLKRSNSDLANDYGNLVQRVLSFIYKNCDNKIPQANKLSEQDKLLLKSVEKTKNNILNLMNNYEITGALEELWKIIRESNIYIDNEAPWALKNTNINRMHTVLNTLCNVIRKISLIALNFVPEGANKILNQLAIDEDKRNYINFNDKLKENVIDKPYGVFPRLDKKHDR